MALDGPEPPRFSEAIRVLEAALGGYVVGRRWFRSKTARVSAVRVLDVLPLCAGKNPIYLLFASFTFEEGAPETYVLPIEQRAQAEEPPLAIAALSELPAGLPDTWWCDASADGRVGEALLELSLGEGTLAGREITLQGYRSEGRERENGDQRAERSGRALGIEQSNSTYRIGEHYLGKLLRKVEPGKSVEAEMLEHLKRSPRRPNVAELLGQVAVLRDTAPAATLFLLETFVPNQGDAWRVTLEHALGYFDRVLASRPALPSRALQSARAAIALPAIASRLMPEYLALARLLGQRTAELHLTLWHSEEPAFAPRPHDELSARSFHHSLGELAARAFAKLASAELGGVASELRSRALSRQDETEAFLEGSAARGLAGSVMRIHGDYHLGQVLYTGADFVIIDFDGEPQRSRAERRRRRSPLADVAGMLRSFHYAATGALSGTLPGCRVRAEVRAGLAPWAELFALWAGDAFLSSYLPALAPSGALPSDARAFDRLLDLHLLEKALYELGYELDNRPDWVELPLLGLLGVLDSLGREHSG